MLFIKSYERLMNHFERLPKSLEPLSRIHRALVVSSEVLGIDDKRKEDMDPLLEISNLIGKLAHEGFVEEDEISKKVMANEDVLLSLEAFADRT